MAYYTYEYDKWQQCYLLATTALLKGEFCVNCIKLFVLFERYTAYM